MESIADPITFTLDAGQWLRRAAAQVSPAAESLAEQLLEVLVAAGIETHTVLSIPVPDAGGQPAVAPVDPQAVLQALSRAVGEAGATLAAGHLAVAATELEAWMKLAAGPKSTAQARVLLRIAPEPYH